MKKLIILFVVFILLLVGCAPAPLSPMAPTRAPKPTSQYKIYKVTKGTGLYAVCGDADAAILAELSEGTKLYNFGRGGSLDCCKFEDTGMQFELCHMEVVSTGKEGWVLKQWFK
jgi:hypothetical protein